MPEQVGEFDHSGYVHGSLPNRVLNPERDVVDRCGNPTMIDEMTAFSTEGGFPICKLRREKYVSSN